MTSALPMNNNNSTLPDARPPSSERRFVSPAVDALIDSLGGRVKAAGHADWAKLFSNCYPVNKFNIYFVVNFGLLPKINTQTANSKNKKTPDLFYN